MFRRPKTKSIDLEKHESDESEKSMNLHEQPSPPLRNFLFVRVVLLVVKTLPLRLSFPVFHEMKLVVVTHEK